MFGKKKNAVQEEQPLANEPEIVEEAPVEDAEAVNSPAPEEEQKIYLESELWEDIDDVAEDVEELEPLLEPIEEDELVPLEENELEAEELEEEPAEIMDEEPADVIEEEPVDVLEEEPLDSLDEEPAAIEEEEKHPVDPAELHHEEEKQEEEVVYQVEQVEDEDYVKPAKLIKLPNLVDYMLSMNLSKSMLMNVEAMLLKQYEKYKDIPEEKAILVECMKKVMKNVMPGK